MRALLLLASLTLLAGCGSRGQGNNLQAAAEQSDPAAKAVLENAAHGGADPQQALQDAGNAQADSTATGATEAKVQNATSVEGARPNLPQSPNRKDGSQPPDKVAVPVRH